MRRPATDKTYDALNRFHSNIALFLITFICQEKIIHGKLFWLSYTLACVKKIKKNFNENIVSSRADLIILRGKRYIFYVLKNHVAKVTKDKFWSSPTIII